MATSSLAQEVRPKPRPMLASAPAAGAKPAEAALPGTGPAQDVLPVAAPTSTAVADPAPMAGPPPGPAAKATAAVPAPRDPGKGAVTNLPLPRFVSLKTNEGNARRGPGLSHRIDWVFTLAGMPLKITAEHEHWRRVEDAEGFGGWVHYSLLSGVRSVLVAAPMTPFYSRADTAASVAFQAEAGVVARVIACADGWCRVSAEGQKGWVQVKNLWGVTADEVIE